MSGRSPHQPNEVPLATRLTHAAGALVLVIQGAFGVIADDLLIPTRGGGVHLSGVAAWLTAAAMLCAACVLLAVVVDHYDRRENEEAYRRFGSLMSRCGWFLAGLGAGLHTAGVRYPAVSNLTSGRAMAGLLVFAVFMAMSFTEDRAARKASRWPVRRPTASDEPSARTVPKAPVDAEDSARRPAWAVGGLIAMVGGAVVLIGTAPRIFGFMFLDYVSAAVAIVAMVGGWLLFRAGFNGPPVAASSGWAKVSRRLPLALGAVSLAALATLWLVATRPWSNWTARDEAEHPNALDWHVHFDDLEAGRAREWESACAPMVTNRVATTSNRTKGPMPPTAKCAGRSSATPSASPRGRFISFLAGGDSTTSGSIFRAANGRP